MARRSNERGGRVDGPSRPLRLPAEGQVPPAEQSDRELVTALQAGDERAALHFYHRVHEPMSRTLAHMLRQRRELLEDLSQASIERAFSFVRRSSFEERVDLSAWARAVARNVAIDYLRREAIEREIFVRSERHELPNPTTLERALESRAELRVLQIAASSMASKYAHTVLLHDLAGYELAEIAAGMGVSLAAAQSRLVRGRRELMKRCAKSA